MSTAVITAWSAVSPYGTGRDPLAAGLRARAEAPASAGPEEWTADPEATARVVPGFDSPPTSFWYALASSRFSKGPGMALIL
ncbi:hypothetical protein ABT136_13795 [Streptomyces sp. NPDC001856]|uniref:hypothetical protein n=1 Tax=Streptomyces sp. NPDC001856 TaxID=3154399 RepID=UPI003321ED6E